MNSVNKIHAASLAKRFVSAKPQMKRTIIARTGRPAVIPGIYLEISAVNMSRPQIKEKNRKITKQTLTISIPGVH